MTVADIIERLGGATAAAVRLGRKRTAILQWRARGKLPPKHLWAVADALGVPADTLRHLTEPPAAPQPRPALRQEAA